ncbi:hypothetical protein J6590_062305 [Homalodisca vitripennis]|nr:hypothetical protein J6590_062305 [Homalodisca vitripennis]
MEYSAQASRLNKGSSIHQPDQNNSKRAEQVQKGCAVAVKGWNGIQGAGVGACAGLAGGQGGAPGGVAPVACSLPVNRAPRGDLVAELPMCGVGAVCRRGLPVIPGSVNRRQVKYVHH